MYYYWIECSDDGGIRTEECYGPDTRTAVWTDREAADAALLDVQHEADSLAADGDTRWPADSYYVAESSERPRWAA